MDLFIVKPGKQLCWPPDLVPRPEGRHSEAGWRNYLIRHPELRVRGEEGYVVDVDAPLESEWLAGQGSMLMNVAELPPRDRPKEASPIDFPPALTALAEAAGDAPEVEDSPGPAGPSEDGEDDDTSPASDTSSDEEDDEDEDDEG